MTYSTKDSERVYLLVWQEAERLEKQLAEKKTAEDGAASKDTDAMDVDKVLVCCLLGFH